MQALVDLAHGFAVALSPANLSWALVGSVLGTAIGVLPGIGPALTIALLLPVTTGMNPTGAFIQALTMVTNTAEARPDSATTTPAATCSRGGTRSQP